MRKFTFRLQSVLGLRISEENALLGQLAALQRELADQQRLLDSRRQDYETALDLARKRRSQIERPELEALSQQYLTVLTDRVAAQEHEVEIAAGKVAEKLEQVKLAMTHRKALEHLRERHLQAHIEQTQVEETNSLDDFAAIRAARSA